MDAGFFSSFFPPFSVDLFSFSIKFSFPFCLRTVSQDGEHDLQLHSAAPFNLPAQNTNSVLIILAVTHKHLDVLHRSCPTLIHKRKEQRIYLLPKLTEESFSAEWLQVF